MTSPDTRLRSTQRAPDADLEAQVEVCGHPGEELSKLINDFGPQPKRRRSRSLFGHLSDEERADLHDRRAAKQARRDARKRQRKARKRGRRG